MTSQPESVARTPDAVLNAARDAVVTAVRNHAPVVIELGEMFDAAGYELALVGGPVRDALLGRLADGRFDLDLTTSATPDQTLDVIGQWADSVWEIGREYGTIGCRKGEAIIEITTYRADEYDPTSRKPDVKFGTSLTADLRRRDFAVNAMAITLPTLDFVDPYSGLVDAARGVIRTPGAPAESFDDDPLRMMRAVRFVSQLGFTLDEGVREAITNMTERLTIVSAERIQVELVKLVKGEQPRAGLDLMVETGLADYVLPELPALRLEVDEHHHHKDVYEHTLTVLDQSIALEDDGPDFILRFAALMHDVGKPATRKFEKGGRVSFHHHEVVGAKMTRKRMRALKFDNATTKTVCRLVELHLRFHGYRDGKWSDSAVRRYVTDAGDVLERLHKLTRADCTTRNKRKAARLAASYDDLEKRIAELAEQEELNAMRPDLDGARIMELLDIAPGPLVGRAYKYLLGLRMDEGPLGEEEATTRLREWWSKQPESTP